MLITFQPILLLRWLMLIPTALFSFLASLHFIWWLGGSSVFEWASFQCPWTHHSGFSRVLLGWFETRGGAFFYFCVYHYSRISGCRGPRHGDEVSWKYKCKLPRVICLRVKCYPTSSLATSTDMANVISNPIGVAMLLCGGFYISISSLPKVRSIVY